MNTCMTVSAFDRDMRIIIYLQTLGMQYRLLTALWLFASSQTTTPLNDAPARSRQ